MNRNSDPELLNIIELGVNHEEQHPELLVTRYAECVFHESAQTVIPERGIRNTSGKRVVGCDALCSVPGWAGG